MKKVILLLLFEAFCSAGFSENLRWKEFGSPIPARADLDVRWNASTNKLPSNVWVYHLLPRKLSPEIISNLMAACSFTEKDKTDNGDLLIFNSPDGSRHLRVTFSLGIIDYELVTHRSLTNLIKDVPSKRQALKSTKKLLPKLGINLTDLEKDENGTNPQMVCYDGGVTYFINRKPVQNIEFCAVRFGRAVDGIKFVGAGTGGDGRIEFGNHGKISRILLTWRNMERAKCYPIITANEMIKSIHEGKAVQGDIPGNVESIDWNSVKSVTIKKIVPCYFAAGGRFAPSDLLYPFAALDTTVDTGHGSIDVEIDCPIIDETKLLDGKK